MTPVATEPAPIDVARQSQSVLREVLADARRSGDPSALTADPRLANTTIYADPVSCGPAIGTSSLVPHPSTEFGCPACPHPTIPMPVDEYLKQFPADRHLGIIEQLATSPPQTQFQMYAPTSPPASAPWWASLAVGTVAGTLILGGLFGLTTTRKGDAALQHALRRDCPALTAAADVAAASVACNDLVPGDDIQVVDVQVPKIVPLRFSFCDGRVCGDADPDCASNRWIPQFAASVPRRIIIGPLPGASIDRAAAASLSGAASKEVAAFSNGTTVTVALPSVIGPSLDSHRRADGRLCGLTEDEYRAFRSKFGEQVDNGYTSVRVAVRWRGLVTGSPPVRIE